MFSHTPLHYFYTLFLCDTKKEAYVWKSDLFSSSLKPEHINQLNQSKSTVSWNETKSCAPYLWVLFRILAYLCYQTLERQRWRTEVILKSNLGIFGSFITRNPMNNANFWGMTLCTLLEIYQRFRETCYLYTHCWMVNQAIKRPLNSLSEIPTKVLNSLARD